MSWLSDFFSGGTPAAPAANAQIGMLEAQNAKHDAAVGAGKKSIDDAFSKFDDPYFESYGQSYRDAYNPTLTDQYGIAKDKLSAILAGRDQLESTTGANSLAQLGKTYNNAQIDIGNKSVDATNALRANVDNTKTNLYNMNANAADPYSTAQQAQASAGAIVSPQSYPGMANVFGDALSGFSTAAKANSQSSTPYAPSIWNAPTSGAGSAVVG